jgi:hypothetical protein
VPNYGCGPGDYRQEKPGFRFRVYHQLEFPDTVDAMDGTTSGIAFISVSLPGQLLAQLAK